MNNVLYQHDQAIIFDLAPFKRSQEAKKLGKRHPNQRGAAWGNTCH